MSIGGIFHLSYPCPISYPLSREKTVTPVIGLALGGVNFENLFVVIRPAPNNSSAVYFTPAEAATAGAVTMVSLCVCTSHIIAVELWHLHQHHHQVHHRGGVHVLGHPFGCLVASREAFLVHGT